MKKQYIAIDYIAAPLRMAYYMEYSTRIFQICLKYIAPEDISLAPSTRICLDEVC